jgi:hypothetical protein
MIYFLSMPRLATFAIAVGCFTTQLAFAGGGHDHGEVKAAAGAPALPRFATQSELFDAVGILNNGELIVFIDRAATNEPVVNATVELESGSTKLIGKFEDKLGEYHFDGKPFAEPGEYSVTLTIKAGQDNDLLTADFDVRSADQEATHDAHSHGWQRVAQWSASGLVLAAILFFLARFVLTKRRNSHRRTGATA